MLQTVFEESQRNQSEAKRKRNIILDVIDQVSATKRAKVDLEATDANINDGPDLSKIVVGETSVPSDAQFWASDADQSKLIVTKLLQVFGMSVLGAVRSLPAHNEVDMSLGIAGLYSLKAEKERVVCGLTDLGEESLGQSITEIQEKTQTAETERESISEGLKSTHPFSVRSPKILSLLPSLSVCADSLLLSTESSQTDGDQSGDESALTSAPSTSTSTSVSAPWQLSQTDRTTSFNSSTTTEDHLTQESLEDSSNGATSVALSDSLQDHETVSIMQPEKSPYLMKTFSFEKGISPTPLFAKGDATSAFDKSELSVSNVSSARLIEHFVDNPSDGITCAAERSPTEKLFNPKAALISLDPAGVLDLENIKVYQGRTQSSLVSDLSLMTAVND